MADVNDQSTGLLGIERKNYSKEFDLTADRLKRFYHTQKTRKFAVPYNYAEGH
jgi:hypothetical protein